MMKPLFLPRLLLSCCLLVLAGSALAAEKARKAAKPGKPDATERLFGTNAPLFQFDLEVSPLELALLQKKNRDYVRANLRLGTNVIRDVGIHLKGNGSFRPLQEKPSFVVKFDRFVPDQRFLGLSKIALNNSSQDGTYIAEYMANWMFREANVPCSRVSHGRVSFNGRDLGLYVVMEMHTDEFLQRWFGNDQGSLYEAYLADVDSQMDQDNGDDRSQRDRKRLAEALKLPEAPERWRRAGQLLDMDRYASHLVCELFTAHTDGYAMNRNNYRIYHHPETDRFTVIAHGTDWGFQNTGVGVMKVPQNALITRALLTSAEGTRIFKERRGTLFTNLFQLEVLTNRVHQVIGRILALARNASETNAFRNCGVEMNNRLVARWQNITNQIYGPPPITLAFDADGGAALSGWREKTDPQRPAIHAKGTDGPRQVLRISTSNAPCLASWRTTVSLPAGKYLFQGEARAQGIVGRTNDALPGVPAGAGLRISGGKRAHTLDGDSDWTRLSNEIVIEGDTTDVELVCELRAQSGQVWFDAGSLRIVRRRD